MGGGGQTQKQSGSSQPTIPAWLKPYYRNTASGLINAQGALPSLTQLYGEIPLLNVPNVSGQETLDIAGLQNAIGLPPEVGMSSQALQQFLPGSGTQGGMSSALQQAEGVFNTLTVPEIEGQASLMGLGNSGAALSAISQGQQQAYLPLIEQGTQNELTAAGQLGQLGLADSQQTQQNLQDALISAGIPREVAAQQAQALYNQALQKFEFAQAIQGGGAAQFPALLGQGSSAITTTSQPKF